MNPHDDHLELIWRYMTGDASQEESILLESLIRDDALFRSRYLRYLNIDTALRFASDRQSGRRDPVTPGFPGPFSAPRRMKILTSQMSKISAALAAGFLVGLAGTSIAWTINQPRFVAKQRPVPALSDGGFEQTSGQLPRGFPSETGYWSGDEAEIIALTAPNDKQKTHVLGFLKPEPDAANPESRAISCDVFQLVDMRPWKAQLGVNTEATLELSANYIDARPPDSRSSVTLFCQIFLFSGDPSKMQENWPLRINEAISSASANFTSTNSAKPRRLKTRCLFSREADFAVVQLAARPNVRPAQIKGISVDDVTLNIKIQPVLPVR